MAVVGDNHLSDAAELVLDDRDHDLGGLDVEPVPDEFSDPSKASARSGQLLDVVTFDLYVHARHAQSLAGDAGLSLMPPPSESEHTFEGRSGV